MSPLSANLADDLADDLALGEPTTPRRRSAVEATARIAADVREMRQDMALLRAEAAQLRGAIDACTAALRWLAPRVLLSALAGGLVVLSLLVGAALAGLAIVWETPEALYLAAALPALASVVAGVLAGAVFTLRLPGAELSTEGVHAPAAPDLVRG